MSKPRATEEDVIIGENITRIRLEHGASQKNTGKFIGVTFQQIQKYENGTNRISAAHLYNLAKFFSVSIVSFYVGVGGDVDESISKISRQQHRNCRRVLKVTHPDKQNMISIFLKTLIPMKG